MRARQCEGDGRQAEAAPGAPEQTHTHPYPMLVLVLTAADEMQNGAVHTKSPRKPGDLEYVGAGVSHKSGNVGAMPLDGGARHQGDRVRGGRRRRSRRCPAHPHANARPNPRDRTRLGSRPPCARPFTRTRTICSSFDTPRGWTSRSATRRAVRGSRRRASSSRARAARGRECGDLVVPIIGSGQVISSCDRDRALRLLIASRDCIDNRKQPSSRGAIVRRTTEHLRDLGARSVGGRAREGKARRMGDAVWITAPRYIRVYATPDRAARFNATQLVPLILGITTSVITRSNGRRCSRKIRARRHHRSPPSAVPATRRPGARGTPAGLILDQQQLAFAADQLLATAVDASAGRGRA